MIIEIKVGLDANCLRMVNQVATKLKIPYFLERERLLLKHYRQKDRARTSGQMIWWSTTKRSTSAKDFLTTSAFASVETAFDDMAAETWKNED